MKKFDLIIIGGGRASHLASKVGKLGKKVALIEKSTLGGTCANRGCVPSKLLIGYADVIRAIEESNRHYINSSIDKIDIEKIFENNNSFINSVDENHKSKLNENVKLFRGIGFFVSNNIVEVNNEKLTAPKIIIATGASPKKAPFEGAWTSDDIFPINKIPKSITIVGSGFIACELVNVFDALGVKTKLLVRSENILSNEDEDISKVFKEEFSKKIDIEFNTTIKDATYKDSFFDLTLEDKAGKTKNHTSEALLYAIGRESNAKSLNLKNTSIKLDDRGFIKRDKFFQTDAKGVYVVGDAAGKYMLQHAASYEMNYLYKILFEDENRALEFKYMPHAVFTDPEIASVGVTEKEAKEKNLNFVVSKTDWLTSAKAQGTKLKYPFTKLIVDKKSYKILGCHMIGPQSSTMIHQVLTVMHIDNDIRHLKEMLYIHPALSESLLPAAINIVKKIERLK
ncbi:NAD(P)/FAD-dependent oxidoreductase [Sulfurimonas sp.]|uniref:dihydrolipoyl dehydrogenase family protein n=1 Tax=Sulfurimonas sp. TaxID=2022749 RepID=UPI0025DEBD53|nr:dihydrolipoyl dehydrogenase [Sulfurimonas sp.]MCK9454994.1 dihydrolipoyl dehydrogenase [Sulfurimonas sp.]